MGELRIIDHIIRANPDQELAPQFYRWGPEWRAGARSGRWIVHHFGGAQDAIRCELDPAEPKVPFWHTFNERLNYWVRGQDKVDEHLRSIDIRVNVPERVSVPAGASFSMPVPASMEDALAELNEKARRELDTDRYPAPEGCPEPGVWVRAVRLDDDMQPEPEGKWHYVTGWNGRTGGLGVRCYVSGRNRTLNRTFSQDRHWRDRTLLRSPQQPGEDACQRCIEGLERDSKSEAPRQ